MTDPWDDQSLFEAFIEENHDLWNEWCQEDTTVYDKYRKVSFCEKHQHAFLDFAENYLLDLADSNGERSWELNEER